MVKFIEDLVKKKQRKITNTHSYNNIRVKTCGNEENFLPLLKFVCLEIFNPLVPYIF